MIPGLIKSVYSQAWLDLIKLIHSIALVPDTTTGLTTYVKTTVNIINFCKSILLVVETILHHHRNT